MALYAFALGLEKKGFHAAVWAENIQLGLSAMALGQKESASRLCAGSRPAAGTPVWAANQLDDRDCPGTTVCAANGTDQTLCSN
eukprot:g2304.t1